MSAKFAQHFLINKHACERIVEALELTGEETILEIGPGKGALTALTVPQARRVVAVEIDPELVDHLRQKFSTRPSFTVVNRSILDFDPGEFIPEAFNILGNLPYNLTSPILRRLCEWNGWSRALVMVQKEVGDRMTASVGTPDYGALTVGMNLSCELSPVFELSETSFKPPPRVRSSVVKLIRREHPLTNDISRAQRVIQAAFQQRRKTILNALSHGLNTTKEAR
jgi:16S rRNA (adenine1518-N6/adenine1519-N6)-dimethyltransferase